MLKQCVNNTVVSRYGTVFSLAVMVAITAFSTSGCSTVQTNTVIPARTVEPSADLSSRHQQAVELMQKEQWQSAVDTLAEITSEQPALSGPWLNLGIAQTKRGNSKAAEDAFNMAVETNPDNVEAYNQLGMLYRRTGRPGDAQETYEAALEIEPENSNIHWNLAILHDTDLPDPDKALLHYQRYRQITGSDDPLLNSWINTLVKASQTDTITAQVKP